MNSKELTAQRAMAMLSAAGCTYAVIMPDGTKHGTLELAERKRTKKKSPENDFNGKYGYIQTVRDMKVGDALTWNVESAEADSFRGSVSSQALRSFGQGNAITAIKRIGSDVPAGKVKVEILRVA